jgi:D-alanyl-D-alanine carboxypeptidase
MEDSLEAEIRVLLNLLKVPGALVILKSETYNNLSIKYGFSNLEDKDHTHINDKFRIGSCTKMFTGIMLLQLYENKLVDLDDPVSKYLLGVPDGDNITIRDIGSMRSGLFNYTDDPKFIQTFINEPCRNWLTDEIYAIGISHPLNFPPNTDVQYSNTNTLILGLIIERLTKHSYMHELNERIVKPMKLTNTKLAINSDFPDPKLNGYSYNLKGELTDVTYHNPSWAWAAGGIVSDIKDMNHFMKYAIGKHKLLNRDATKQQRLWLSELKSPYFKLPFFYGFQLERYGDYLGHNGSISGYNSICLYDNKTNTNITIACNLQETSNDISPAQFIGEFIIAKLNNMTTLLDAKKIIKNFKV